MIQEIFKYSMFVGIIIGITFIIYTNLSPKSLDKSIVYLNLFVLFFTLHNLQITIADYNYIELNFVHRKLLFPFYALIIPAFYTFVAHYLRVEKQIKSFVTLSYVLFFIEIIIRIFLATNYFYNKNNFIVAKYAQIEEIVNLGFTIFLFLKVVYVFLNQSKLYEQIASYDNMKWLKKFLLYGFVIIILWVFAVAVNINEVIFPNIFVYYPLRLSSNILILWIAYNAFFHYNLLTERIQLRAEIKNEKPTQNALFEAVQNVDLNFVIVQNHIIENKKYLIPEYSLENLATETNISVKKLSHILHKNTNFGFPDYINSLRVQKVKKYLKNPKYFNYTIIAIGLECGFNSKSTFYRAFIKLVGMTPSAYRQKNS